MTINKQYTKSEYKITLAIAVTFTILYFINLCILVLADVVEWSDTVNIINWLSILILHILVVISWGMVIGQYFVMEYQKSEKPNNWRKWVPIIISIVILVILGRNILWTYVDIVDYIGTSMKYIEEIYVGVGIKVAILLGWTIHWIYSLAKRHSLGGQQGVKVWKILVWSLVLVLLVYAEKTAGKYAYEMKEDAAWDWWVSQYEGYSEE